MNFLFRTLFSMGSAVTLLLIFALAIATATFIENDYGTQTAKAVVYNAKWFELLLIILALTLVANIYRYRMWRSGKRLVFMFHAAFIVILVGAAVTRYVGYEGMMHIREGGVSNTIVSDRTFLQFEVKEGSKRALFAYPVLFSKLGSNSFSQTIRLDGKALDIRLDAYIPDAVKKIEETAEGAGLIDLMISDGESPRKVVLKEGETAEASGLVFSFGPKPATDKPVLLFQKEGEHLRALLPAAMNYMRMDDQQSGVLEPGLVAIEGRHLYSLHGVSFVMRNYLEHGREVVASAEKPAGGMMQRGGMEGITLDLQMGEMQKGVTVIGAKGVSGNPAAVRMGAWDLSVSYGSRTIELPFALKLKDFQLERYPGSNSPSSYASEVEVIDAAEKETMPFRIYMNHVLDYRGYRFFQSSYDRDEMGTILSVNHDPGTLITYIGYALLFFGLFATLLGRSSRFQTLMRRSRDLQEKLTHLVPAVLATLLIVSGQSLYAQDKVPDIDAATANQMGTLLVQNAAGRIEPVDTLARDLLHKVIRKNGIEGQNHNQVLLGMMIDPKSWQAMPMIRIALPGVNEIIGIPSSVKYAKFEDFFDFNLSQPYKLLSHVETITRKRPAMQSKLDKEILKVDERINICYMVYTGALFRIFPDPRDKLGQWFAPMEAMKSFPKKEGQLVQAMMASYFTNIDNALDDGQWEKAEKSLEVLKNYQQFYGASVLPPQKKIEAELTFNRLQPFKRLIPLYLLIGILLLGIAIYNIIRPTFTLKWPVRITMTLLIAGFAYHTFGLGLRWYISGHAPWSDGYESMIYIAWATVLAGFLFSRKSPVTLASTAVLSGLILFVAHLNWMDPQITNLVPVLKSYWLLIHVSMITASYGFLGLGALLAFITLWLIIILSEKNCSHISLSIKELSHVNEMSLIFGLTLLTVGNFLGGIWANESWGRYWGWDPKETWALVTILIYAVVLHLRFVKPVKSVYAYNVASLLAFSSVIMTYFGVNFYLSGLHSYAKGDPVPIPTFVYYVIGIVGLTVALAYRKRRMISR